MLAGGIKSSVFEKFKRSLKEAFVYPRHFCVAGVAQAGDTKVSFQRGKGQVCRINAQNLQNLVLRGRRQSPQRALERTGQWVMIKSKGVWHLEVGSGEGFYQGDTRSGGTDGLTMLAMVPRMLHTELLFGPSSGNTRVEN